MCTFHSSDGSKDIQIGLEVDCRNTSMVVGHKRLSRKKEISSKLTLLPEVEFWIIDIV